MLRFKYSDNTETGSLHCEFCDGDFEIAVAHTWWGQRRGNPPVYPGTKLVIFAHFNFDENAQIPECKAILKWRDTDWDVVNDDTAEIKARGRVLVEQNKTVTVVQDWPPEVTKEANLRDAGYKYSFDRMAYINRKDRKVFSVEAIEDNSEEWLKKKIAEPNDSGEWQFFFTEPPPESVIKAFLAELEHDAPAT